jgi:hypothetical protein
VRFTGSPLRARSNPRAGDSTPTVRQLPSIEALLGPRRDFARPRRRPVEGNSRTIDKGNFIRQRDKSFESWPTDRRLRRQIELSSEPSIQPYQCSVNSPRSFLFYIRQFSAYRGPAQTCVVNSTRCFTMFTGWTCTFRRVFWPPGPQSEEGFTRARLVSISTKSEHQSGHKPSRRNCRKSLILLEILNGAGDRFRIDNLVLGNLRSGSLRENYRPSSNL